jgi:hypothetical protein
MIRRRRRWIYTDPLPPVSQYVNVLGSKLKLLLRAPSGVDGNTTLARSWADEVSFTNTGVATKLLLTPGGLPTLGPVASLFAGKDVLNIPTTGRFSGSFTNPLINTGDSPELFAVFKANSLSVNNRNIIRIQDSSQASKWALFAGVDALGLGINNGAPNYTAFLDTTAVHFFSGRRDVATGNVVLNIDGVDIVGGGVAAVNGSGPLVAVSSGTQFDGSLALCGLVQSAMSAAERAEVLRIARQEFGF